MTPSSAVMPNDCEPKVSEKSSTWPDWTGQTVVCVATGPSLTAEQVERVHVARLADRCRVVAINEAGLPQYKPLAAPWADILYAADLKWWIHYRPEFYGLRVSGEVVPGVHTIPLTMLEREEKMPHVPGAVVSAGHSGFQALGLALTLGANRVILLGYDCGGGVGRNCHKDRPSQFKLDVEMSVWTTHYNRVPIEFPDVEFINCSDVSAITAFEKRELEKVL